MHFASETESKHDPYLEVTLDQFQLIGRSIAGIETVMTIPQWNVCIDAGRAPDFAFSQDHLALTHWHLDHAGGVAFYLGLRHLNSLPALQVITPPEKIDDVITYLRDLKKVSDSELMYNVVAADKTIRLKRHVTMRALSSFHSSPSCGYLIEEQKHHLKPEFQGRSTEEIIRAKQSGVSIEEEEIVPMLAVSGDTKREFFETEAVRAKYLMMECSFFGDDTNYEKIRAYGHTHIKDWKKYAERIESHCVIMTHTSQRYSKKDIEVSCRKSLPKELLDRLIVFR